MPPNLHNYNFGFGLKGSWPDTFADNLGRACWQGGLFLLGVWAFCRLLPRLPVKLRHWLWWLACLKLVLTLFWPYPLSLPSFAVASNGADITVVQSLRSAPVPPVSLTTSGTSTSTPLKNAIIASASQGMSRPVPAASSPFTLPRLPKEVFLVYRPLSLLAIFWAIWLTGLGWNLCYALRQLVWLRRVVHQADSLEETEYAEEVQTLAGEMGLRRVPRLLVSESVKSPLIAGYFHPVLVVPVEVVEEFSPEEWRMVLAHELAHLRRGDLWLTGVPMLAQSLFFFFPLVLRACREWTIAREAACDADAVQATHCSPAQYGEMLVRVALRGNDGKTFASLGMTSGYHTLKSRLQLMEQFSPQEPKRGISWGKLATLVGTLLLVIPWRMGAKADEEASLTFLQAQRQRESEQRQATIQSSPFAPYILTDLNKMYRENGGRDVWVSGISGTGHVLGGKRDHLYLWDGNFGSLRLNQLSQMLDSAEVSEALKESFRSHRCRLQDGSELRLEKSKLDGTEQLIRYQKGKPTWVRCLLPGGSQSTPLAMNDRGQVIGLAELPTKPIRTHHAFLYDSGVTSDLNAMTGNLTTNLYPTAINNQGWIVGTIRHHGNRAFLYRDGKLIDLSTLLPPDSGWSLQEAIGLNDAGQIVGYGLNASGQPACFLLTPRS